MPRTTVIARRIDNNSEKRKALGGRCDRISALCSPTPPVNASTSSAAERGRHRRDQRAQAVQVDVERQPCPRVPAPGSTQHLAHVGRARQSEQTRFVLERVAEVGLGQVSPLEQPQHQARVDAARPRGHHEALERRETHRRVDRPPTQDRAQRRPSSQVAAHNPQARRRRRPHQRRRPPGDPRVRQPMEPVSPNAPSRTPIRGQRVRKRRVRQRGVERRVEARHRRHPRERPRHRVERGQRFRLVERSQVDQFPQRAPHARVDHHRREEPRASVHDPVPDRVGLAETAVPKSGAQLIVVDHRPRRGKLRRSQRLIPGSDDRQLETARAGVDDEDSQLRGLLVRRGVRGSAGTAGRAPRPSPRPVTHHRDVVANLPRVRPSLQPRVGHVLT